MEELSASSSIILLGLWQGLERICKLMSSGSRLLVGRSLQPTNVTPEDTASQTPGAAMTLQLMA